MKMITTDTIRVLAVTYNALLTNQNEASALDCVAARERESAQAAYEMNGFVTALRVFGIDRDVSDVATQIRQMAQEYDNA